MIGIVKENQISFREGYQASDNIFTLGAIIEYTYGNWKALVHPCFIDCLIVEKLSIP